MMGISTNISTVFGIRYVTNCQISSRQFWVTRYCTKIIIFEMLKSPNSVSRITRISQKVIYLFFDSVIFSKNRVAFVRIEKLLCCLEFIR